MKPSLSIIIPCYNCEETLEEAFDSCFTQGLKDDFEVVMVDDKSTDGSRRIMEKLAERNKEVRIFFHEKNQGGGATRNTAVKNSQADIVFCLDSDDILPPGTLKKMYDFMLDKACDGVGVQTSIKFEGTNINDVAFTSEFGYADERIPFESLVEKTGQPLCPLYSTFMFTKRAFAVTGGYPTDHGFDTQGFAWRFLAHGLIAYTCPGTRYLHRVNFKKSYYIREYESGKINHNWLRILQEFLYVFTPEMQKRLLDFDLNNVQDKNIFELLKEYNAFKVDYQKYLEPSGDRNYQDMLQQQKNIITTEEYWLGLRMYYDGKYPEAFGIFENAIRQGLDSGYAHYYLGKSGEHVGKRSSLLKQEKVEALFAFAKHGSKLNIASRSFRKIKKIFKSNRKIDGFVLHMTSRYKHPRLIYYFLLLRLKKLLRIGFDKTSVKEGTVDVVIPTLPKDMELLDRVISSLSKLNHHINKIYIVAPQNQAIKDFCRHHDIAFIEEDGVLGYGKKAISYTVDGLDRSGWIFQQLLKLSGDRIVENENYFVLDSDTIICGPFDIIRDGKFIFYQNEEWHQRYFDTFKELFGYSAQNRLSFTSHMMVFNKRMLKLMKEELERKHSRSWDKAYISMLSQTEMSCISDYDTYANWVICNFPDKVMQKPLYNKSFSRKKLGHIEQNINKYSKKYKTLSFHSYIK